MTEEDRSPCPPRAELEALRRGSLSASSSAELERHLALCSDCAASVRQFEQDEELLREIAELHADGSMDTPLGVRLPEQIGPFRILDELGRGGMGIVYLGEQDKPLRQVAIKVLPPLAMTTARLARFDLEVEALGRLTHPSIAQIHEAGLWEVDGGTVPYFAMEYVEGASLDEHLRLASPDLGARLRLFLHIAHAVAHAHRRGVLHRDLKPSNVLVSAGRGEAKVIDFGLARLLSEPERAITRSGQAFGSPAYMAPEQTGLSGTIDTRVDVYGLGALLHFLLTGRGPLDLEGLPLPAAILRVRDQEPSLPSARVPGLPRELDWVVQRALEKDPDARYSSVDELARDVEAYRRNEPMVAAPRSLTYRARLYWNRNRGVVVAGVLMLLLLSAGLLGTSIGLARETRAAERATDSAALSSEIRSFLVGLFRSADPSLVGARKYDARDLVLEGGRDVLRSLQARPRVRAALQADLGEILRRLGELDSARRLLENSLELQLEMEGENALETHRSRERLALVHLDAGHVQEGLSLLERSVAGLRTLEDEGREALPGALGHLGAAYAMRQRFDEAIAVFDELTTMHAARSGSTSIDPGDVQIAGLFAQSGQAQRALELFERCVRVRQDTEAQLHEVPWIRSEMAHLYQSTGQLERAGEAVTLALEGLLEVYGPRHPRTVRARQIHARQLVLTGELERAEAEVRTILQVAQDDQGLPLRSAWLAQADLGQFLREVGHLEESLDLLAPAVEALRPFGEEDPAFLVATYYLGSTLLDLGRLEEAVPALELAYDSWVEDAESDLGTRTELAYQLGLCSFRLGRYHDVIDVLTPHLDVADALGVRKPVFPVRFRLQLGQAHQALGDWAAAVRAWEPVLPSVPQLERQDDDSLGLMHNAALGLHVTGRTEDALAPLRFALLERSKLFGRGDLRTLKSQNGLGVLLTTLGRFDEAHAVFADNIERARAALGEASDDLAWFRFRYAELLVRAGEPEAARDLLRTAIEAAGPSAPTRRDLAELLDSLEPSPEGTEPAGEEDG